DIYHAANRINPRFIPGVRSPKTKPPAKRSLPKLDKISAFYRSVEWKRTRYDALVANDGRCELCGAGKPDGVTLNVDHIKPLRLHWGRRLDRSNLQVLCGSCNQGKGNRDDTDWREPSLKVLMGEGMK
ncbi:MAG: HNH endonuclease, partial [Geminicoccaceae bacterium]